MISRNKAKEVAKMCRSIGIKATAKKLKMKEASVSRYCQVAVKKTTPKASKDNAPVLIIPDLHAPYNHPDALEFLQWVHEWRGCQKRVVSVGDLVDFHSMSRHISETDAHNATLEYEKALDFSDKLAKVFPHGDLVLGNHDLIPQRQMKELGLITRILKENNDLYGLPDTWNIHNFYHVIKPESWNVLVEHGIGSGGKYGCANTAKEKRCSFVQGHTHSAAAAIYSTNHESTIFGMNVGCLVDSASLAMRYGKYTTRKGVLGCGVVYSGEHAEFIPMSTFYKLRSL